MKKRFIMIITTIVVCLVFVVTMSYAWFTESNTKKTTIDGSTPTAYYKSGDGTESNPYVIARPVHLYNFAWLQYMGTYNKLDSDGNLIPTYFKIESDETDDNGNAVLDMSGTNYSILPPIGTETNPFVGNFDGNNTIIKGLTTSSNDFKLKPASVKDYTEPHILGFFGYVGQTSTTITGYDSSINTISNLYIDDYTVKNTSNSPDVLVGLLAGYANAQINNSGVLTAQFDLVSGSTSYSSYGKISKYSLIGDYNADNFTWAGKPSGGSGDIGYGTSTDIRALYDEMSRLNLMEGTTGVISSSTVLPFKCSDDSALSGGEGSKTITTYGRSLTINYSKSISVAEGATNIGYYSGPEIKTYKDYFAKTKASDDYEIDYDNITVAEKSEVETVDSNIKTYLTTEIDELTRKGDSALVLSGTNYLDTSSLGVKGGYNLIKNAKVGNYEGDLLIPYRSIWVAPIQPGKFQMIIVNKSNQTARLAVWKVQRNTPKDYSTGFVNAYYDSTVVGVEIPSYSGSGAYIPYYYGVEVTQEDIDNGYEFVITKYIAGANVYITYIDVGANGGDGEDTDDNKSPIDFVYFKESKLVPIQTKTTDTDGNVTYSNNSSYVYSNAFFEVDGTSTGTLKVQFKRTLSSGTTETITLTYYFTPSIGITTTPNKDGVATSSSEEIISGS